MHRYQNAMGTLLLLLLLTTVCSAEPIVLKGAWVPQLLGKPVASIRICDTTGNPIPFQIDEMTADGEFVCNSGTEPNSTAGNGVLDSLDEIVFMREDGTRCEFLPPHREQVTIGGSVWYPLWVTSASGTFAVRIASDATQPLSIVKYVSYDHTTQLLTAPRYYAAFAPNRFHFTRAGVRCGEGGGWTHLTRELKVEISLKALWGMLPIHYTEDNMICYVKRYKVGPIRCIRRGDFHLRLGLGVKGSRAAVYQVCYPQMVSVPVKVHIPVRFRTLFSSAWIEMTPVIDTAGAQAIFSVPECSISRNLGQSSFIDSLYPCLPVGKMYTVADNRCGYGWFLTTDIPKEGIAGSGFVVRPTTSEQGIALCGFRLSIRDVHKGRYTITNRVLFPSAAESTTAAALQTLLVPTKIVTNSATHTNLLVSDDYQITSIKSD